MKKIRVSYFYLYLNVSEAQNQKRTFMCFFITECFTFRIHCELESIGAFKTHPIINVDKNL